MRSFRLHWPGGRVVVDGPSIDVRYEHDGQLLVVREDDAPAARHGVIRAPGLWVSLDCEEPGVHWTIGLEAFALAVEHPDDDRGDLVPLGFDLEWEAPGRLHGEVLVGDDVIDLDVAADLTT
jgi:hypothetical protein